MRKFVRPQEDADGSRYFCQNQKVLTTAYTNFNTFGLCLTLGFGTFIIIISYALEPLLNCAQKRWRSLDKYSRLEWCINETLQLQRLAHEELGLGVWQRGVEAVPITEVGARLGMLDLTDLEHPRLKAPPPMLDEVLAEEAGKEIVQEEVKESQKRYAENDDSFSSPPSGSVSMEESASDV
ncbi:hypothetical protein DBV05_g12364 [Lasiodiplodia theobromae]|uniref:Uncharacterized protein n=1 Tax=Lasiodiplodia theobromae TaxID=45133 RepID=A0A5N5CUD6_9PEZI|nr:hypothetical protein DBV05_g12364 [Lasiodiplodia theobromae]